MTDLYTSGIRSHVRKGTLKMSIAAGEANTAANLTAATGLQNPEDAVVVIDRVVAEIKTAAEAACNLVVGIGDNASDNVGAHAKLLEVNAMNVGAVSGPAAGVNANCRVNKNGETSNAYVITGASVNTNADSLVADIYVDYIIP